MSASSSAFFLIIMAILFWALSATHGYALGKRNAEDKLVDYPNYRSEKLMPKRAALVLDQLLGALLKAMGNEELRKRRVSRPYIKPIQNYPGSSRMQLFNRKMMELRSPRQAKARVFWRCYFNAVTCFGRK